MPEWLIAVIVGAIAALPALLTAVFSFYRNKADIAETYEGIAHRAAIECERLRAERNMYRIGAEILAKQLEEAGIEPIWKHLKG
jgi:hypothetical protein